MGCNASFQPKAKARAPKKSAAPLKKGYVYGFFDLKDAEEFKNVYAPMAEPTLTPYGGKFIMKHALVPAMAAKMGMKESKGFGTTGQMAFMLEFGTFEKAMSWFTGPEYTAVLQKRDEVADFKMAVVEGAPIPPGSGLVVGFFDMTAPEDFKTVYEPMEPTVVPYGGSFAIKHALVPAMAEKMGMKESKGFGTTGQMAFVLKFANFEKAMGWFTGPEYAAVLQKRDEVADFKMAVVETIRPPNKGYVYGFFDLNDPEEFENVYAPMAEQTLTPYGGKFIMKHALDPAIAEHMGMKESKGFGETGQMAFMLEFDTFEKAMSWFTGPEYTAVLKKRDEVADFKMAVVEGAPIPPGSGLVVGFFDMTDPVEFRNVYAPMAEPTLVPYGGSFAIKHALVPAMAAKMGMKATKSFGTTGQMAFVLNFADFDTAMDWFTGDEYAAVLEKRDEVADFKMAVAEAMPECF